jgi:hypothetical protein
MRTSKTLIIALATSLALASPSFAKPGKGRGADKPPQASTDAPDVAVDIRLGTRERDIVREYYSRSENCPPGLAKKRNGCLPPGIAKKRYELGKRLPPDVVVADVPIGLIELLPRLPEGRVYRFVDNDLGIVELSTLILVDALELT